MLTQSLLWPQLVMDGGGGWGVLLTFAATLVGKFSLSQAVSALNTFTDGAVVWDSTPILARVNWVRMGTQVPATSLPFGDCGHTS